MLVQLAHITGTLVRMAVTFSQLPAAEPVPKNFTSVRCIALAFNNA